MEARPVSTRVNKPGNGGEECIAGITEESRPSEVANPPTMANPTEGPAPTPKVGKASRRRKAEYEGPGLL